MEQRIHQDGRTNPEIAYWVLKYILLQGQHDMTEIGLMFVSMQPAAASQDMIGWYKFMEGKVSTKIASIQ